MDFVKNKNLAILDVETTGIKAGSNKIIELYILKVLNEKVVDDYYSKFNPKQNIPLFISNLTGIYQWHVEAAPIIDDEILNALKRPIGLIPVTIALYLCTLILPLDGLIGDIATNIVKAFVIFTIFSALANSIAPIFQAFTLSLIHI